MVRETMARCCAALLLLILVGCATMPEAATPQADLTSETPLRSSDAAVTISFAAFDYEQTVYEQLARSFSAEHPNIKVVIIPMADLITSSANPSSSTGEPNSPFGRLRQIVSGADTASASIVPPEAFGTSLLYNLAPLMDADPGFERDDFYPGALERYTHKGGTWVLPRSLPVSLLSYNKELFKQAGVAAPQPGLSWADLRTAAQQLARTNGATIETYGIYGEEFRLLLDDLDSQQPDLFTTPFDRVQLDTPEVVAAFERMRALRWSGAVFSADARPGGAAPPDPAQLMREGRLGIWGQSLTAATSYPEPIAPDSSIGTLPYPPLGGALSMMNPQDTSLIDGYVISGGTNHPNEAWRWIEYINRQQIDPFFAGTIMPARKSLAEASGFWNSMDAERAAAYQWSVEHAPAAGGWGGREDTGMIIDVLLQAYLALDQNPEADPAGVLGDTQREVWGRAAQNRLTPTATPDLGPVAVEAPPAQEAPEGATTVTFPALGYDPVILKRLARAFSEQHPDIFVEIQAVASDNGLAQLSDVARGNDCFWWANPLQSAQDVKALLDLRPLMDADMSFPRDDIPAALYGPYGRGGGVYGLPYSFKLRSLGFNRIALDAAGLETPTADWTSADFLRAVQALTDGQGNTKRYGYVPFGGSNQDLFFFIHLFGGQISTGSGDAIRPNFTDPRVIQAIQWYIDLSKVHKVAPPLRIHHRINNDVIDNSYDLIRAGRAGLWFDLSVDSFGAGNNGRADPIDPDMVSFPFEADVAPRPVGAGGLRGEDLDLRGFHISASSAHAQECWTWIKFLSGELGGVGVDIPARRSLALSEDYARIAAPGLLDLYRAYSEALGRPSQQDNMAEVYQRFDLYWFFKAISAASEQDKELSTQLAEAQRLTTAYLDCMIKERQEKAATCARNTDPDYQGFMTRDGG
ncbi:MAG TPA: extracellular solute-binding protein [Roseiflexaceae bacterium]|nr:extracellular solute-binding protein [Roseiflexaceae bacterium]